MSTPGQSKPQQDMNKSTRIPPPLPPVYRKPRSQSLTPEKIENPEIPNNENPTEEPIEKLDFAEIRKRFESRQTIQTAKPNYFKKRPSVATASINHSNSLHVSTPASPTIDNLVLKLNSSVDSRVDNPDSVKSVKPKSASPTPFSDETNHSSFGSSLRTAFNSLLSNGTSSSIEENETPLSSKSLSFDSSSLPENNNDNNDKQRKPVREMLKIFDVQKHHLYQFSSSDHQSHASNKLPSIPDHEVPTRRPPRPEIYIKSQKSEYYLITSSDMTDSPTGDSSLSSNANLTKDDLSDPPFSDEEEDYHAERQVKLRRCLEEVHATEKTYVNILYVLSVKLSAEVKNTCDKDDNLILTFNNTYKPLLGAIQQIYQFHNNILSPEFEAYILGQRTGTMWSVLGKHIKVIEILYKNYYVNFCDTHGKLDDLCKTNSLINEAMLKCQKNLGNLYPIAQLNCPNQRLLRYILCMKTYMKYLDENSAEYKETRSIHDELDGIAGRCEEELLISAAQLNDLKERLDNKFECFKEHRKLLWHGSVKKISPRRYNDIASRYIILFSDCILVCTEESGRKLEINRELSIRGITVEIVEGSRPALLANNDSQSIPITYYAFRLNAVEKSYEFLVEKESDRDTWIRKLRQASEDFNKRYPNIEIRQSLNRLDEQQYGSRAPKWVNDLDVSRCQNCNNRFRTTIILSRRHHCRCCGQCICGSCSTKKLTLDYCKNEGEVRVCDKCYTHFTGIFLSKNSSIWPKSTRDVDRTILFGDFRSVNSGVVVWIALQEDFQLHVFSARLDQAEDYAIVLADLLELRLDANTRTFELKETTKNHTFSIDMNHQLTYPKNDIVDEQLKAADNKLTFYANLWYDTLQLARSTTFPDWYLRKRDSTDSGVGNVA